MVLFLSTQILKLNKLSVEITRCIISTYLINCGTDEGYKDGVVIASKLDDKILLEHIKSLIEIFTFAKENLENEFKE